MDNYKFNHGDGDWGLGNREWGIGPNPQTPDPKPQPQIPNPQSPLIHLCVNILKNRKKY